MTNREQFIKGLGYLCEAFRKEMTETTADAYWLALKDMEDEAFAKAIQACLRECRFMPSPAEIRDRCAPNVALEAAEQWLGVIARWRDVDPETVPDLNPISEKVLRLLGGYECLGQRTSKENDTWTRKEFIRLYVEVANSPAALESIGCGNDMTVALFGDVADAKRLTKPEEYE